MTTGKTTNIKSLLRDECLPALNQSAAYFSMADVLAWLNNAAWPARPPGSAGARQRLPVIGLFTSQ
jgi:hypothetical protein